MDGAQLLIITDSVPLLIREPCPHVLRNNYLKDTYRYLALIWFLGNASALRPFF